MPLQIRRGTETERLAMTQKLAAGEPLWITSTSKLYIGDGTTATPTLSPVTGFTASDAQDAAASLFTTATHSGITFTYDNIANTLTAQVNLSTYNGVIHGDLNGSVFADNSTLLVDGQSGLIPASVVQGTFTGAVVGNVTGELKGSVFADDSTILVDGVDGVLRGTHIGSLTGNSAGTHTGAVVGNVTGNVTAASGTSSFNNITATSIVGDVKGSLYGDDSSLIIDANSNIINIRNITHTSGFINIGTNSTPLTAEMVSNSTTEMLNVRGITTGSSGGIPFLNIRTSKGTPAVPTTTAAGDTIAGLALQGYANGDYMSAGTIFVNWESGATLTNSNPASKITIATGNNTGGVNLMTFDRYGTVKAPVFNLTSYANDAARLAAIPTPAAGMMVFMASGTSPAVTNKVVAYDGSAWVALH